MKKSVAIGIIGDFDKTRASHAAINQALVHASYQLNIKLKTDWLTTPLFETTKAKEILKKYGGIIASGSPYKSMKGVLAGIKAARESNIPFIGT